MSTTQKIRHKIVNGSRSHKTFESILSDLYSDRTMPYTMIIKPNTPINDIVSIEYSLNADDHNKIEFFDKDNKRILELYPSLPQDKRLYPSLYLNFDNTTEPVRSDIQEMALGYNEGIKYNKSTKSTKSRSKPILRIKPIMRLKSVKRNRNPNNIRTDKYGKRITSKIITPIWKLGPVPRPLSNK